jgi:hypothetical protein
VDTGGRRDAAAARGGGGVSGVARRALECAALLADARDLVLKLDEARFAAPGPGDTSSVGAHLRHALDYAAALVAGLPVGRVDYDQRARDSRVEREPLVALDRIEALRAKYERLAACEADRPLSVRSDEPGAAPIDAFVASTLARELRAVASHTVHHFAVMALALRAAGVAVDRRFGLAPSTQAHEARTASIASEARAR